MTPTELRSACHRIRDIIGPTAIVLAAYITMAEDCYVSVHIHGRDSRQFRGTDWAEMFAHAEAYALSVTERDPAQLVLTDIMTPKDAWRQYSNGYGAARNGAPSTACPFRSPSTVQHRTMWELGWHAFQESKREAA